MLFAVILPAFLMLLLGILYGDKLAEDGSGVTMVQQAYPAVLTISICATGLMGIPITLSGYREKKVLIRFMVTPTSPLILLMASFLNQLVTVVISVACVTLIGFVFFGYTMIGSLWAFSLTFLVVLFSIYALGMMVASVARNVNMANLLCSLLYFPMFFLSGATVPYEIMPKALRFAADLMPLTHGIKLLKKVSYGSFLSQDLVTLGALILLAIVCMLISIKTFRYDY